MKTVLVPVESHAYMQSVLDAALLIATRFGSHIEGLALGPDIPEASGFDVTTNWTILSDQDRRELVERARQVFEDFMHTCAIPRQAQMADGASYDWAGRKLFSDSHIGSFGRVFDLIVLGRPGRAGDLPRQATAEAALFESGRPVLLAPPSASETIGERILVAWNGSTETARTVALGMPFLAKAELVTVLTLDGWGEGPTGEELASRLRRNGIRVESATRGLGGRSAGEAILEYAATLRADLIVKGAYTQSRLRQMIFGGATSHLLAHATLPILMAH